LIGEHVDQKELTACDLTEDSHALYLAPLIVNSSAESTAGAPPRRTCISLDWTKQTASDRLTQFGQLESSESFLQMAETDGLTGTCFSATHQVIE